MDYPVSYFTINLEFMPSGILDSPFIFSFQLQQSGNQLYQKIDGKSLLRLRVRIDVEHFKHLISRKSVVFHLSCRHRKGVEDEWSRNVKALSLSSPALGFNKNELPLVFLYAPVPECW